MLEKRNKVLFIFVFCVSFSFNIHAQEIIGDSFRPDVKNIEKYFGDAMKEKKGTSLSDHNKIFYKEIFENRLIIGEIDKVPDFYENLSDIPAYNEALRKQDKLNPKEFNPFNYKLNYLDQKESVFYKMYDTDYYIIISKWNPKNRNK